MKISRQKNKNFQQQKLIDPFLLLKILFGVVDVGLYDVGYMFSESVPIFFFFSIFFCERRET